GESGGFVALICTVCSGGRGVYSEQG
ncbi:hypothetical protein A2U01_0091206, partial [Trifolium medium]|nr:hypothetical protein [Trifolium medium]